MKCLDLFKLSDKANGRSRDRPFSFNRRGLPERSNPGVNDFRHTTSMPVISMPSGYVALISDLSGSQYPEGMLRRKGLVSMFPYLRGLTSIIYIVNVIIKTINFFYVVAGANLISSS